MVIPTFFLIFAMLKRKNSIIMKKKKNSTIITASIHSLGERKLNELSDSEDMKGFVFDTKKVVDRITFRILNACCVPRILAELRENGLQLFVNGNKVDISLLK